MTKIRIVKGRGPVVHLNRNEKAKMIDAICAAHLKKPIKGMKILDIGCGNGGICKHFAKHNEVAGVDIEDKRKTKAKFDFRIVNSARLPFAANSFDLVISNHTIEHIPEQSLHLKEIKRVLKKGGIVYLATPNKSSPIMEGHINNPDVLKWKNMQPLFEAHGFKVYEKSLDLLKQPSRFYTEVKYGKYIPKFLLRLARPLFPSHVFILKKES